LAINWIKTLITWLTSFERYLANQALLYSGFLESAARGTLHTRVPPKGGRLSRHLREPQTAKPKLTAESRRILSGITLSGQPELFTWLELGVREAEGRRQEQEQGTGQSSTGWQGPSSLLDNWVITFAPFGAMRG
jgi:hypothetical protein